MKKLSPRVRSIQVKVKQIGPPACATYGDPRAAINAVAKKAKLRKVQVKKNTGSGKIVQLSTGQPDTLDVSTTVD